MANPPVNRRPGVDADIFQGQWLRGFDVPAGNNDPAALPCDILISNGKSQIDQSVSNLIFANRKDDIRQPIFVMAIGNDPSTPIGVVKFHIGTDANPNGIITTSTAGSLYASYGTPGLWQLQVDTTTWVKISDDLGGENLNQTLAIGNITGGISILLTNGDFLRGENSAVGTGASANIAGGNATGALGNGGAVNIFGGTSFAGSTGAITLSTPNSTNTASSGTFLVSTGTSLLGGVSGGVSVSTGNVGAPGIGGTAGLLTFNGGNSNSTVLSGAGSIVLSGGFAQSSGNGGRVFIYGGHATGVPHTPFLANLGGRGGFVRIEAGNAAGANEGASVSFAAGAGGPAGGDGGSIILSVGAGGGGNPDGEIIGAGVFRSDNIKRGNGDPNLGAVAGNEGDIYQRLDLGLGQLWLNTNGSANGWVQLAHAGDFIEAFEQMSWGWVGPAGDNPGGTEPESYHDMGIWHGLLPDSVIAGGAGATITRGAALSDGPVLSFTIDNAFVGNTATLDLSAGGGSLPHAREHGPILTFRIKNAQTLDHRIFIGLTTLTGPNQLGLDTPAGGDEYMGFLLSPALTNWRTITRDGISTSNLDTGISKATTNANANAYWFVIDASDTTTPVVRYFIFDPDLNLVSSIIEPNSLPGGSTRLGLVVGIRATVSAGFGPNPSSLLLDHATIVNQGDLVGQGGGTGIGGLALNQVLINGNTTGTTAILINQGSSIQGVTDDNVGDGAGYSITSGATTLAANNTGSLTVASSSASGAGAINAGSSTGFLFLGTGFQSNAASLGDTGSVNIQTGDHLGTDGTTGNLVLRTGGFTNGAAGTRTQGDILIAPGSLAANTATVTGDITIKGGSTTMAGVTGGDITILSGENSSASGNTGSLLLQSSSANLNGNSGLVELLSGDAGGVLGTSGNVSIQTGQALSGSTGNLLLGTGGAGNGLAGSIFMSVGNSSIGNGQDISLSAGATIFGGSIGGSIILTPGSGPGGDGQVIVNGKLTVTGLIDPTGLLLTGQAIIPVAVPGGDGLLWVDNTGAPSKLIFTDDVGTNHDISTGGGVTSLGALSDVTLTAPVIGEVLTFNGAVWVNLAGFGGSPLATILGLGNTTGALPIVISDSLGARVVSDGDLVLDPAVAPGNAVVIDGLRWPEADGLGGYVLTTNGIGQLSFQPGGGGGSSETFAEVFSRMQWGTAQVADLPSSVQTDGILDLFTLVSPGAPIIPFSGSNGTFISLSTGPILNAEAGVQVAFPPGSTGIRLSSLPVVTIKFDGPSVDTNVNFFVGLTTALNLTAQVSVPAPLERYVGVQIYTSALQTTLNFVTDNATGVPTQINSTISALGSGFYLTIDASVFGSITLNLYDSTHTQLATHTFVANLPGVVASLGLMVGARTLIAGTKVIGFYNAGVVTRADLLNAIGGGGNQNLASVLGFGNETNGLPIKGSDNLVGAGGILTLQGGASTGGGGAGGALTLAGGAPDPAGNGVGGSLTATTAAGAGLGSAGGFVFTAGNGGPLGGSGGGWLLNTGNGIGVGAGGGASFITGNGGVTGGLPGAFTVQTGNATGGNVNGALIDLRTGDGFGTGDGGGFQFLAGDGGAVGGDGGSFVFTVGAGMGGGVAGTVAFTGDTTITGKLTVTGLIDPTGLLLASQVAAPFVPLGTDGGIWVNNAGELVFTNFAGDLNLSTAIGGGPTWLDAILTAGYGFLGAGNPIAGPQSYGVYGSSINSAVSPGPPPAAITFGQDSDGPFLNIAIAADPLSEAFLGTADLLLQRNQRFKARFKFQSTSPAHTDERLFIGFTDDLTLTTPNPQLALDHPVPGLQYMGLAESLAGFNLSFVSQGSGGAIAAVFAIPTDALVHFLEIDASAASGDVTFTIYAADGITVQATHTELASFLLPDLANPIRPFIGIHTATGTTPRALDFYDTTIVVRADIVDAVTGGGGGGTSPLSAVLAAGNTTGGTGILVDSFINGDAVDLLLNGGTGGAGSPVAVIVGASVGDNGGDFQVVSGAGAGAAGDGGDVQVDAGAGSGTGDGGTIQFVTGAAAVGGGDGGDFQVLVGSAAGVNGSGGNIQLSAGTSFGTAAGGAISLTAGGGGSGGGTGDGGDILLSAGLALGTGDPGNITFLAGGASPGGPFDGAIRAVSSPFSGDFLSSASMQLDRAGVAVGGSVTLTGGQGAVGSGGSGGVVTLTTGPGDGAGSSGRIHLLADGATPFVVPGGGGDVQLIGRTGPGLGTGGAVVAFSGTALFGGTISVLGGAAVVASGGTGGPVFVLAGAGDGVGVGGLARVQGGPGGATGNGGAAQVQGGTATGGVNFGGDVRLTPGVGPAGSGLIAFEGKIHPASATPGLQYGAYVVVAPGVVHPIPFTIPFPVAPTSVTYSIESPVLTATSIMPGSVIATSFVVTTAAPLGIGDIIRWFAVR